MSSHVQPAIVKITLKIIIKITLKIIVNMIMIKMIMDAVFAVHDHYQCIQSAFMIMINAVFFISEMNVMFCFIYFSFAHLLVNALLGNCCNQHQETGAE